MPQSTLQDIIQKTKINFEFISDVRKGSSLTGYIDDIQDEHAGVRIGIACDLAELSEDELRKMGLNPTLRGKLYPYLGRRGQAAESYLQDNPLNLSQAEVKAIDYGFQARRLGRLIKLYNAESDVLFCDLPECWQTVLTSFSLQYKQVQKRHIDFWQSVIKQDWQSALVLLQSVNNDDALNHQQEIQYLLESA